MTFIKDTLAVLFYICMLVIGVILCIPAIAIAIGVYLGIFIFLLIIANFRLLIIIGSIFLGMYLTGMIKV